jgi:hypothetical protein
MKHKTKKKTVHCHFHTAIGGGRIIWESKEWKLKWNSEWVTKEKWKKKKTRTDLYLFLSYN